MKNHTLLSCFFLFVATSAMAQSGPWLSADLPYAVDVCTDTAFASDPVQTGIGTMADLGPSNDGCLNGERQGTWVTFQFASAGAAAFTILPTGTADHDFAVWGPFNTVPDTVTGAPLRCSWASGSGATGLSHSAVDLTEGTGGDQWVSSIAVNAGERFLIYIDNFSMTGIAFAITWDLQEGASLQCQQSPEAGFMVSSALIPQGGTVDFTDTSVNGPYAWYWELPGSDVGTSSDQHPAGVRYDLPGCYDVTLTAFNAAGQDVLSSTCQLAVEVNTGLSSVGTNGTSIEQRAGYLLIQPDGPQVRAVSLVDMLGRTLLHQTGQGPMLVRTSGLPAGVVVVRVQGVGDDVVRRFYLEP